MMAQSEQKYTVAGTSVTPDGIKTFRFSNGAINLRTNMLKTNGHTEINLIELPRAMDQIHAIAWLMENVRGCKGAVISTRAVDKEAKSEKLLAAEQIYQQRMKSKKATPVAKTPQKRQNRRNRVVDAGDEAIAA